MANSSKARSGVRPVSATVAFLLLPLMTQVTVEAATKSDEWYRNWTLEAPIERAHLVMVAKVTNVSQLTVVEGAKTNTVLREYRFQPIRKLKGVYTRGELAMTSTDLGCPTEDGTQPPPLTQGEYRLLILARRTGGYGCSSSGPGPIELTVPRLKDLNDPIITTAEAIVEVTALRSRKDRAELAIRAIQSLDGPGTIPMLDCIRRRAIFAARDPSIAAPLIRLAKDESPAIRYAAIETIRDVLWAEYRHDRREMRRGFARVLREFLAIPGQASQARIAAYQALGYLGRVGRELDWPAEVLIAGMRESQTTRERLAAASALGHLKHQPSADAAMNVLKQMPLDVPYNDVATMASAVIRLDASKAEAALLDRLQRSIAAELPSTAEILYLATLRSSASVPLLLELAEKRVLSHQNSAVAQALVYVGDERALPLLTDGIRQSEFASDSLRAIRRMNAAHAAVELRSWFKNEPQISRKLGLAGFLGKHGMNDGYSVAIQYVADREISVDAARALGEINDPRTAAELLAVLNSNPDHDWMLGAIAGLLAIGHGEATPALLQILNDDRHPAILHAAEVASLSQDPVVLLPLAKLAGSRNPEIAAAAVRGLLAYYDLTETNDRIRFVHEELFGFEHPEIGKLPTAVADELSNVFLDPFVARNTRLAALRLLRLATKQRLVATLQELSDQPTQEGGKELARAELILRSME